MFRSLGYYTKKGQFTKAQQKQACFTLKSQVTLALPSVFYPGALGTRTVSGNSPVLPVGVTEALLIRNMGLWQSESKFDSSLQLTR